MIVTSKIKLDMAQPGNTNPVYVVQGDGNTRAVDAELLANGSSWTPDVGWEAAITYRKPDGSKGLYNLLDDGSSAITISGSTATVILAQQMMTVPGTVRAAIVFNNQRLDQLTSFPFLVSVARNQFAGAQQSEDYIRLQWLEDKLEERIAQLISTEEAVRAGVAAQEATIAAAAAQEQAAVAGNAAASASTAAAEAQAVVDGIVPEVEQLRSDLTGITPDDTAVDGKPWTSKRIIDTLCPPFSETGNPAQCYPVEGYPLGVNIRIAPIQEGEGDPGPENVRPITGTVAVQIVHSNDAGESNTYDIALPETVYGGTLDLQTGLLTVDRHIYTLTGDEAFVSNSDGSIRCSVEVVKLPANKYAEAIYSHYVTGTMFVGDGMLSVKYQGKLLLSFNKLLVSSMGYTVESLKAYLKTQYDGGTPVQACYCLDEPYEIQLTPQQVTALSGVNTIYTDADGVIVTGAKDPKHTIGEPGVSTKVNGIAPDETGNVTLTAADVGALPLSGGDMTGAINMNGQPISGLNDPTEESQAARKGYVDAAKTAANAYTDAAVRKAAPRNLLDNSDFRNPVNQRGQTSYSGIGYSIDRWTKENYAVLTPEENGILINNTENSSAEVFIQKIDEKTKDYLIGKKVTMAIKTQDGVFFKTDTVSDDIDCCNISGDKFMLSIHFFAAASSYQAARLAVNAGKSVLVEWIAIYEGEYTAETLPEYQPKGYGAELAECQRYYQIRSANNIAAVDMRPTMRLSSPTITSVTGGYAYSADL